MISTEFSPAIAARVEFALRAIRAAWVARMREELHVTGSLGYVLLWVLLPVFQLATAGLIYEGVRPALVSYAVVGSAASTLISNMLYYVGQTLDTERMRGTLTGLFLAPAPRLGWLTGLALAGGFTLSIAASATVLFGALVFDVRFNVNWSALLLSILLFLIALWGLGFAFSALGLWCRRSNDVSNLVAPLMFLLGGVFYPISALPVWLRIPADALPVTYGVRALVGASLHNTPISALGSQLFPLAGFALVLPFLGIMAFGWVERLARKKGQLELY